MILPSTCIALHNIQDKFYYNGIEINKANFDITEFALVCDKINDFKYQIKEEKLLNIVRTDKVVIGAIDLHKQDTTLLCKIYQNDIYFGLYNNKNIVPLTKDIFNQIKEKDMYQLSYEMNKIAGMMNRNIVKETNIKDKRMILSFDNYIANIKDLSNSFQHTYELEFVTGYKEFILTDEELKQSIIER